MNKNIVFQHVKKLNVFCACAYGKKHIYSVYKCWIKVVFLYLPLVLHSSISPHWPVKWLVRSLYNHNIEYGINRGVTNDVVMETCCDSVAKTLNKLLIQVSRSMFYRYWPDESSNFYWNTNFSLNLLFYILLHRCSAFASFNRPVFSTVLWPHVHSFSG